MARVRQAIQAKDTAELAASAEPLERTLQLFKGLAGQGHRPPGGG
jgi:hypothetical protein